MNPDLNDEKCAMSALCIFSETLSPQNLTDLLEILPSESYLKGQPFSGVNPQNVRRKSVWILRCSNPEQDLAEQLRNLLDFVESRQLAINTLLATCLIEFRCGYSSESGQGGTILDKRTLFRLAQSSLDLRLDLYPPGPINFE